MLLFEESKLLNKILLICLAVWMMAFMIPNDVWASVQRMGIAKGNYSLAPRGELGDVSQVKSYCMDYHRPGPTGKNTYFLLLSGSGQVIFKERTISLQKAIDNKLVAIRGVNSEEWFQIFFKKEWLKKPEFIDLSPQEQLNVLNELRVLLLEPVEESGTHTHLSLVNMTDKPVQISFTDNTILGGNKDTIGILDPSLIKPVRNAKEQEIVQESIWRREHQKSLRDLGYLPKGFVLDGKPTKQFKDAVKEFQTKQGLKLIEPVDRTTANALVHKALLQNRVRHENKNGGEAVLIVEMLDKHDVNGEAVYAIYGTNPPPKITSSIAEITDGSVKLGQKKGNGQIRLEFDESINVEQRELLATNIRLNQLAQNLDLSLTIKALTTNLKTETIRQYLPVIPKYDSKTQRYSAKLDLKIQAQNFVLKVTAKTKEAVRRIIQEVMRILSKMPANAWNLSAPDFEMRIHEEISKIPMPKDSESEVELTIDDQVKKIKISEKNRVKRFNLAKAM